MLGINIEGDLMHSAVTGIFIYVGTMVVNIGGVNSLGAAGAYVISDLIYKVGMALLMPAGGGAHPPRSAKDHTHATMSIYDNISADKLKYY